MTICRKCGKEIPDGEELCEDCKSQESNSGESYLDDLMKSMGITESEPEKPEMEEKSIMEDHSEEEYTEFVLDDLLTQEDEVPEGDVPELVLSDLPKEEEIPIGEEEVPELDLGGIDIEDLPLMEEEPSVEEEMMPELDLGGIQMEDLPSEQTTEEEAVPEFDLGGIEIEDLPSAEEEIVSEAGAQEEVPVMEAAGITEEPVSVESEEDEINNLLELLSKDYSDEESMEPEQDEQEEDMPAEPEVQDVSAPEVSLFSDDESDDIFADNAKESTTSMEDIFQDALSVVDDSEEEDVQDTEDDVFALEGDFGPDEGIPADDEPSSEEPKSVPLAEPVPKKEKKNSFWRRIFGNVVTDQTAEEEAKEREQEKEEEEARAAAKEEKAKQAAEDKEAKEAAAQEAKEKKAALKAEQAAAKAAAKEEKKKRKAELAAVEVVGKINPVGATIVMIFFGLICVFVIFGTRSMSYRSALSNARTQFEAKDYEGAYEALAGVNVSETYQELADKIRLCMKLQKELNSYENYYEMKMYLEALDSLVKGIRNYDEDKNKADEYEILNQYNELESKITSTLFSEFGVSETEARMINSSLSQEEYTAKLEEIIDRWEAKNAQDER